MKRAFIVFGVLGTIVAAITLLITGANAVFDRLARREAARILAAGEASSRGVITEADMAGLPEPVRRWLRHSQVIGKERARTARLRQEGVMRTKPDQPWLPFRAEQYSTPDPPAFVWLATVHMAPFISLKGRDIYDAGEGRVLIKLLGLFTVADARGSETDQGALVRYMAEIVWFPMAALSDYIRWDPIDANSARATMSYGDVSASGVFSFNEKGENTQFVADRYFDNNGTYTLEKWSGATIAYGEHAGIRMPVENEITWHLPSGDFTWLRVRITEVEYNQTSVY